MALTRTLIAVGELSWGIGWEVERVSGEESSDEVGGTTVGSPIFLQSRASMAIS